MPPLLMFDFDGVVADSLIVFHEILDEACRRHAAIPLHGHAAFLRLFDGNMIEGLQRAGLTAAQIQSVLQDTGARLAAVPDRYPPFPGMVHALGVLAPAAPVYIITSNHTTVVQAYLKRHGIRGIREVLGSDRGASKTRKIQSVAARHPACVPFYIGDTRGDMEEARAAGVHPVAVGWGWHDEAHLRTAHPERILKSPAELSGLLQGSGSIGALPTGPPVQNLMQNAARA